MAQKIQRFNIYGPANNCDDGELCNWSDVEPYIKEENSNSAEKAQPGGETNKQSKPCSECWRNTLPGNGEWKFCPECGRKY